MRAGEVSEVSQDYLKAIWSAQEWGGEPITATELANRFGTTKANVTEVLKRLDDLAYGAGLWQGALAGRSIDALYPRISNTVSTEARPRVAPR